MTNHLTVIAPGPLSLVQDSGRTGFQQLGVSVSGAIDADALDIGNRLVGNEPGTAAIEIMLGGAEFEFEQAAIFTLTGSDTGATLDGVLLATNVSYTAHAGARLAFGMATQGLRAYLVVAGGIAVAEVLGSRSTHIASEIGGVDGRGLAAGDVLEIGEPTGIAASGNTFSANMTGDEATPAPASLNIRVVPGPQDAEFSEAGIQTFLDATYTVSDQSNRQGLRLDGPVIESRTGKYDIVSDAVVNGSVQVPGDGKPIVLLADRQTTGGYAKIATVASVDLAKLGQATPGTNIHFSAITVEEAQELLAGRSARLIGSPLQRIIDPILMDIDSSEISVGVAEYSAGRIENEGNSMGRAELAEINGVVYPISVEGHTPAD